MSDRNLQCSRRRSVCVRRVSIPPGFLNFSGTDVVAGTLEVEEADCSAIEFVSLVPYWCLCVGRFRLNWTTELTEVGVAEAEAVAVVEEVARTIASQRISRNREAVATRVAEFVDRREAAPNDEWIRGCARIHLKSLPVPPNIRNPSTSRTTLSPFCAQRSPLHFHVPLVSSFDSAEASRGLERRHSAAAKSRRFRATVCAGVSAAVATGARTMSNSSRYPDAPANCNSDDVTRPPMTTDTLKHRPNLKHNHDSMRSTRCSRCAAVAEDIATVHVPPIPRVNRRD